MQSSSQVALQSGRIVQFSFFTGRLFLTWDVTPHMIIDNRVFSINVSQDPHKSHKIVFNGAQTTELYVKETVAVN